MERKRKLPARTSARVENANKRRNLTPREERSVTPAPPPPPPPEPVVKEPTPTPPPPLPTLLQPGKPLPIVESAQAGDLSAKEYQSVLERCVYGDALNFLVSAFAEIFNLAASSQNLSLGLDIDGSTMGSLKSFGPSLISARVSSTRTRKTLPRIA